MFDVCVSEAVHLPFCYSGRVHTSDRNFSKGKCSHLVLKEGHCSVGCSLKVTCGLRCLCPECCHSFLVYNTRTSYLP